MKFNISNEEIKNANNTGEILFPKYTSQIINLANQNAQGTRPVNVGQLSELFQEYVLQEQEEISLASWRKWYLAKYPNGIKIATDKISAQITNLKDAFTKIDTDLIAKWVDDLVVNKTFNGLYFQNAILSKLAQLQKITSYRLATPEEESKGIDGFVGDIAYSIKPDTYKTKNMLREQINIKFIYYTKKKTGITVEVEE